MKKAVLAAMFTLFIAIPVMASDGVVNDPGTIKAKVTAQAEGQAVRPRNPATVQTFVFTCSDGLKFVARIENETAWLFLPSGTINLRETSAGTYRSQEAVFRTKDQEGMLEESGVKHADCRNNPRQAVWEHAKLNGADFRAIGNEPGWSLEIQNQSKIVLVTGYGSNHYEFNLPEPVIDKAAGTTRYKVRQAGQEMTLTISAETCRDSMSGEEFESRVEVVINGENLRGCGRALH